MRESLDSEAVVTEIIKNAADGDYNAAWYLIHQIEGALKGRRVSNALFDHAAGFFGALLDLHDVGKDMPSELSNALKKLYLVQGRGRPRIDEETASRLASRVVLLKNRRLSVDQALRALGSTRLNNEGMISTARYKAAYYDILQLKSTRRRERLGEWLEGLLTTTELEELAGCTSLELFEELAEQGALPLSKKFDK